MATFILTLIIIAVVITGMAVGSIFQNKPIKGSCGGLAALGMDSDCEICGGDRTKCDEVTEQGQMAKDAGAATFYDASGKS